MKDRVTLTTREQKRVLVLQRMERGEMPAAEAAVLLEVSVRQVCRLLAGYRRGEDPSPSAFLTEVTQR